MAVQPAAGSGAGRPPFVRYHVFGPEQTDVEVGVPVAAEVPDDAAGIAGSLPGGPAAVTVHVGSHDRLGEGGLRPAHRLDRRPGAHPAGPGWEVYEWIDPGRHPDPAAWPPPAQWRTELVQLLAQQ